MTTDLLVDRIADAATVIDPVFRDTPQYRDLMLCERLGRDVLVLGESPVGSVVPNPGHYYGRHGAASRFRGLDVERSRRVP